MTCLGLQSLADALAQASSAEDAQQELERIKQTWNVSTGQHQQLTTCFQHFSSFHKE